MNKRLIILLIVLVGFTSAVSAQKDNTDFRNYVKKQQNAFKQYNKAVNADYKNYSDSLNTVFAKYLKEKWKEFDLYRRERHFKPMPEQPVYKPDKPDATPLSVPVKPEPQPQPQPEPQPQPQPQPEPEPDQPVQVPGKYPVKAEFFGRQIGLQSFDIPQKALSGISEEEVADYWISLSQLSINKPVEDIVRITDALKLNDWGMYLLIGKMFQTHFSGRNENEQVVFSIFMLNQLGYRARTGRADNELVPLIAFQNELFNVSYFKFGDTNNPANYYILSSGRKDLKPVRTCEHEYNSNGKIMNIDITRSPVLSNKTLAQTLVFQNTEYVFDYSQGFQDFCATYPWVDFSVYANAPLEESFLKSLRKNFLPVIGNKSQEEAVNFLLHFTQSAFHYKSDQDNYGYEKWNFAEETLVSRYSDCDDRAIFFAQLVRHILNMQVVLLNYPNHLATAVKFDNPQTGGDHVIVDNTKYLICDPTYRGANLGTAMPDLKNEKIEVIKLKRIE
jgi:hypothetical protein